MYISITQQHIADLKAVLGEDVVFDAPDIRALHGKDQTEDKVYCPELVVKPRDTEGVAALMRFCHTAHIPVTVQGGRSGLAGAALPIHGGIALSMERLNKIIHIDTENHQVTVEAGVITEDLQNAVQVKGLFYPPDPAGRGWSFIGGNVNTNAGGPRCVKYGVTRDYVLNLEIVLADGTILWTAANTLKFSSGYNLTQLIVGSEGTLAVVTKVVLRLLPHPPFNLLLLAPFRSGEAACRAVNAVFQAHIRPSALEFMERSAIDCAAAYIGEVGLPLPDHHKAHLLIEVDGSNMAKLWEECEKIGQILADFGVEDIFFADSAEQKQTLWQLRRNVSHALKQKAVLKIGEDTVVPRASLPDLLRGVRQVAEKYGVETMCWGHLGDGNLHVNIFTTETASKEWLETAYSAKKAIFELVKSLNGMLSAEHGIGLTQKPFMSIFFNDTHLNLLKAIKKAFDPKMILNPGKIV